MKLRIFPLVGSILTTIFVLQTPIEAGYVVRNGWFVDANEVATLSVQEHYNKAVRCYEKEDWREAARQFAIVTANFPLSPFAQESYLFQGIAYYNLCEYEHANNALTEYIKVQSNPRYFEEAVYYKFAIAEKLESGEKRRLLGMKKLPKWASGHGLAIEIYDDVIAAMPCHEIAAFALVSKGYLLWKTKDYCGAVESFQLVIRRFPKHELAPECYFLISKCYRDQAFYEFQNPDILALAQINYRKYARDFPREERLCMVEEDICAIKEIYAQGLYNTGEFYERTFKPRAAIIYYHNAIHQFPDTCVAEMCREKLRCIDPTYSDVSEERSEERRVGKECVVHCVDLGGRRIIQAEDGIRDVVSGDWSSDVCSSDLKYKTRTSRILLRSLLSIYIKYWW